jgi:hypothetical protein
LSYQNQCLQLEGSGLRPKQKVIVCENYQGEFWVIKDKVKHPHKVIDSKDRVKPKKAPKKTLGLPYKPGPNHPWKKSILTVSENPQRGHV